MSNRTVLNTMSRHGAIEDIVPEISALHRSLM